jgi:hypothetical protein
MPPLPSLTDQDVDEDIASDWNSILDGKTADQLVEESETRAAADGSTADPPEGEDKTPPPQDAKTGRFKSPSTRAAGADDQQQQPDPNRQGRQAQRVGAEGQLQTADPLQTPDGKPIDINRPPSSWRPTARAAWQQLPEAVRTEIHKREGDYLFQSHELRNDANFGRELGGIFQPYQMLIQSEGGTPQAALKDFLQTSALLRTGSQLQKYQTMVNIANRFGISLRDLASRLAGGQPAPAGGQPAARQEPLHDPRVDHLLHSMRTQEQNRAAEEVRATESQALGWMNEADGEGNPLRPYAGDVVDDMVAMIPSIKASNPQLTYAQVMQAAYERAIWANPEIRALLQAEAVKAAGTAPAENLRRVNGARRAASVNVPRRGSTPAPAKPGKIEDTIEETARELGLIN